MKKDPMQKIRAIRIAAVLALLLTAPMPPAWASGCGDEQIKAAAAHTKMAEAHERAGRLKQAYEAASTPGLECSKDDFERQAAILERTGLQLGQQEEKQGRLEEAFDWYKDSGNSAEADRVKMKHVNASPRERNVVSGAIGHFKSSNNDKRVAELRQLAAKNAEVELANEEKAFAANKVSFDELGDASDWFNLVDQNAVSKKISERAERRGDTLLKEDIHRHLNNAKSYFDHAHNKQKVKAVQDKALRLAQEHEKKGEISQAKDFYSLAGADGRGDALEARAEAEHKKSEATRQKKFTKEQGDLEKELGL